MGEKEVVKGGEGVARGEKMQINMWYTKAGESSFSLCSTIGHPVLMRSITDSVPALKLVRDETVGTKAKVFSRA